MESSEVSIFAAQAQQGELHTRMQMTDVVNRRQMRHAHMVNITKEIMTHGMRADFLEVDRISQHVWEARERGKADSRHHSGGHGHRGRHESQL